MEDPIEPENSTVKQNAFLLSMQFGVLKQILSYLPARDLGRAALVCHAWNSVCRILRRERQCIHWFECHASKAGRGIRGTSRIQKTQLNEEFGMVYTMQHLVSMLPSTCVAMGLEVYGTIGTPRSLGPTIQLENLPALSALLIPNITGVKVRTFSVTTDQQRLCQLIHMKQKLLSDSELEEITGIPPGEEVSCLILLSSCAMENESLIDLIIRTLQDRMEGKIAVGGGFGEKYLQHPPSDGPELMGLTFSGKNVKAVSAIIRRSVTKLASIDQVMWKLRSCQVPSENCFAFMFSCMGRYSGRGRKSIESSLFRNHFPSIPLIGFFGSGEIGTDYLPRCDMAGTSSVALDFRELCGPSSKRNKNTVRLHWGGGGSVWEELIRHLNLVSKNFDKLNKYNDRRKLINKLHKRNSIEFY
ncbi:hypothetical protein J437_LFUL009122 [Ladona fulva]|uniref:Uncharacterized protein n=1 Tax=Ladona fulva TaxID=123851 RepID=A0A8K0K7L7_LADFU|nr:hypothetical protein J437_LFUL009122 [Ladona fulva]